MAEINEMQLRELNALRVDIETSYQRLSRLIEDVQKQQKHVNEFNDLKNEESDEMDELKGNL